MSNTSKSTSLAEPGCTFLGQVWDPGQQLCSSFLLQCVFHPFAFPDNEMSPEFSLSTSSFLSERRLKDTSTKFMLVSRVVMPLSQTFWNPSQGTCHCHLISKLQLSFSIMPPLSKERFLAALAKAVPHITPEPVEEKVCESVAQFLYAQLKDAAFQEEGERRKKRSGKSNWASFNAKQKAKKEAEKVKPVICDDSLAKFPKRRLTCKTPVPLKRES